MADALSSGFENGFATNVRTPNFRKYTQDPFYGEDNEDDLFGENNKEFKIQDTSLFQQARDTASKQLAGEIPGFEGQANEARESLKAMQAQREKSTREGLMAAGLRDDGQYAVEGFIRPEQEALRERLQLERNIASDRGALGMQQQQAGQQAAAGLGDLALRENMNAGDLALRKELGLGDLALRSKLGLGDLSLREQQLSESGRQFNSEQEFKRFALERGYQEAEIARAWEATQAGLERESREKVAFAGLNLEERKLAMQAYQFESQQDFDKWALGQNLGENERQRIWQAVENQKSREATQEIEYARLSLQERELAQQAEQFGSRLEFDRWAVNTGFDEAARERAWEASQALEERVSREKIAFAGLSLDEKRLAQEASQFTDRLKFDMWSLQQNMDENERQRVWQAVQNDKSLTVQRDIATMQNDTERWLQERSEILTRAGWTQEEAMQKARIEAEATQANLDRALQREVEAGRLTLEEQKMVQQSYQFDRKLLWDQYAIKMQIDADTAARVWQAGENAKDRALQTSEADLDRQLSREVEMGRLSLEESKLAQDASQFKTRMEFEEWAKGQDIEQAAADRIWQSAENAKDRAFEGQMQIMEQEFAIAGVKLASLLNYVQGMEPEQAAGFVQDMAKDLGLEIPKVSAAVIEERRNDTFLQGLEDGTTSITKLRGAASKTETNAQEHFAYNSLLEKARPFDSGSNGVAVHEEGFGTGSVIKFDDPPQDGDFLNIGGFLYRVDGGIMTEKITGDDDTEYFVAVDVDTGQRFTMKANHWEIGR